MDPSRLFFHTDFPEDDDLKQFRVELPELLEEEDEQSAVQGTAISGDDWIFWDSPVVATFLASRTWLVVKLVLYGVACLLVFVANVLLLATIRRVRYLKTTLNRYVASLAVCDVLMAFYALLRLLALCVGALDNNLYFCLGHNLGFVCLGTVTQMMMLYIAFDCYFSIWHPIRYARALAPWKASVAIFLAWIYSGAIALLPLLWFGNWHRRSLQDHESMCYTEHLLASYYVMFLLAHYGIAVVLVVVVYICVYYEIRTKRIIFSVYQQRQRQRQIYEDRRKRDIQNAHCMAIGALLLVIFWLPHFFLLAVHVFVVRLHVTTLLEIIAMFLCIYHAAFNPLIYLCKLDTFQVACYKVLCCCPGQEFPSRPPSDNIHLHSMSFRNHVTGSMMSLHTTLAGKMVRLPRINITDERAAGAGAAENDIWMSPESSRQQLDELGTESLYGGRSHIMDSEIIYHGGEEHYDLDGDLDMSYPGEIYHRNSSKHKLGGGSSSGDGSGVLSSYTSPVAASVDRLHSRSRKTSRSSPATSTAHRTPRSPRTPRSTPRKQLTEDTYTPAERRRAQTPYYRGSHDNELHNAEEQWSDNSDTQAYSTSSSHRRHRRIASQAVEQAVYSSVNKGQRSRKISENSIAASSQDEYNSHKFLSPPIKSRSHASHDTASAGSNSSPAAGKLYKRHNPSDTGSRDKHRHRDRGDSISPRHHHQHQNHRSNSKDRSPHQRHHHHHRRDGSQSSQRTHQRKHSDSALSSRHQRHLHAYDEVFTTDDVKAVSPEHHHHRQQQPQQHSYDEVLPHNHPDRYYDQEEEDEDNWPQSWPPVTTSDSTKLHSKGPRSKHKGRSQPRKH